MGLVAGGDRDDLRRDVVRNPNGKVYLHESPINPLEEGAGGEAHRDSCSVGQDEMRAIM